MSSPTICTGCTDSGALSIDYFNANNDLKMSMVRDTSGYNFGFSTPSNGKELGTGYFFFFFLTPKFKVLLLGKRTFNFVF